MNLGIGGNVQTENIVQNERIQMDLKPVSTVCLVS